MARPRVLVLTRWYPTPTSPEQGTFVEDWTRVLARFADTAVLHLTRSPPDADIAGSSAHCRGQIPYFGLPIRWQGARRPVSHLMDLHTTQAAIERLHSKTPFDMLHAHAYPAATATRLAARRLRIPYVVTEHFSRLIRRDARWHHLREARFALRGAAELMAVGPALGEAVEAVSGRPVTIVPNPVPDSFMVAPTPDPGPTFRLLSVGRLERIKGFDIGLEALARLRSKTDTKWVIAGEGGERSELMHQADRLGLADHVDLVGAVSRPEVHRLMSSSHAILIPSRSETFSVVAAESLMTGRPVITTRCGGPEAFIGPENGRVVDVADPQALASALESVLANLDEFEPHRLASTARSTFSEQAIEASLQEVYERALSARSER